MPQLRDYQEEDVQKLMTYPAMGCFNEQRTGKTPVAISVMQRRNVDKLLVVCPASALYPWADEINCWSDYRAIVLAGTTKKREKLLNQWVPGTALIVSYGLLKTTAKTKGLVDYILKHPPQGIIVDEAHRFKTPGTAVANAVLKLNKIPYRLALTGTPAPNKPEEVFCILKFLMPNLFKGYWNFIEQYFQTQQAYAAGGRTYTEVVGFQQGKDKQLQLILKDRTTQRKRKDVMPWLPEKDIQFIRLPMTDKQKKYLNELKKYFETEHIVTQGVLDRLIRYRQICLDPQLLDLQGESPKTNWILDYLTDYPNTPTVIFSKFTSYLKRLHLILETKNIKHDMIIGETSSKDRAQAVTAFQAGKVNLLLINIDAGKEALTLDRGECMIFTDVYPPAADIQQAEDRCVSTTEARKDKPYKIYKLMIKDSFDEKMYNLVDNNAKAIDVINNYNKYMKE